MTVDDDSDIEDVTGASDMKPANPRRIGLVGRWIRLCLDRWRPISLTGLLIAATAIAAGLFYFEYRPDHQTGNSAAREAIRAASEGAVALLSYSPDSLTRDFANARSHLADDYVTYYRQFTEQIVAPAAQRGQITTTARVVRAAVSELHPDSAVVLVFINQQTTSKDKPEPVKSVSSVRVMLTKSEGSWLIAKFDTV